MILKKHESDFPPADAIIVQLPLPSDISTADVLNSIPIQQDADVLSRASRAKFENGDANSPSSCGRSDA